MIKPFVIRTLCSGYDSQKSALLRIAAEHPDTFSVFLASWSDIDVWACKGHDQLYPEDVGLNVGDMTKVDWTHCPYPEMPTDLLTYSTPCQDISQAGKQAGFEEGSSTRSGILWHTEDAIRCLRPRFLLQENVRAIINGYPRKSEPMTIPFTLDLSKTKQQVLADISARLAELAIGNVRKATDEDDEEDDMPVGIPEGARLSTEDPQVIYRMLTPVQRRRGGATGRQRVSSRQGHSASLRYPDALGYALPMDGTCREVRVSEFLGDTQCKGFRCTAESRTILHAVNPKRCLRSRSVWTGHP